MKLATIRSGGSVCCAVVISRGFVRLDALNEEKRSAWDLDIEELVSSGQIASLSRWYSAGGKDVLENLSRRLITPAGEAEVVGEIYETEDEAQK